MSFLIKDNDMCIFAEFIILEFIFLASFLTVISANSFSEICA